MDIYNTRSTNSNNMSNYGQDSDHEDMESHCSSCMNRRDNMYRNQPFNQFMDMNENQNSYNYPYQNQYNFPYMEQNRSLNNYANPFIPQFMPSSGSMNYNPRQEVSEPMNRSNLVPLYDYGPEPMVINIDKSTKQNNNFRTTIWTGEHLQVTLMSLDVGEDIGVEMHPNVDQFIRVEDGQGIAMMGKRKDRLGFQKRINQDFAVLIPAGTYHNIVNNGNRPLKIYSIYAPPQHPHGTVHDTKADAQATK